MPAVSASVKQILAGRGWRLRLLAPGRRLSVLRAADGTEAGRLEVVRGLGGRLAPAARFRARARKGATPEEGRALRELASSLDPLLESRLRSAGLGGPEPPAAESHEAERDRDLLVRTSFACNQRCAFCFVPLDGRHLAPKALAAALPAAGSGRGELTLSGGEPTLHPRLLEVIAAARGRGYRRFVLQTNAVRLADASLRRGLVAAGVRTFLVSFHSHKPADYDAITRTRGQFARALAGLKGLLEDRRCSVTVNVVVNARNVRSLPGLVRFLARLPGRRPDLYLSMINEAGHLTAPAWTLSLERAGPWLRRADGLCRRLGLRVSRSAGESSFPPCVFDEPAAHASPRALSGQRVRYAEAFDRRDSVGRAKAASCRDCRFDSRCQGVPATYAARFGVGELRARSPGPRPSTRRARRP